MNKNPAPSRLLYRLTVISFVVSAFLHAIALFAALGIMQPGLDVEKSVLERAIYVAENATVWRMGWHLWQLVALANLAAAVLLMLYFNNVRRQIASVGRLPFALSILALLFTVAAIIPEQWGEYAFVTSFVEQAREAVRLGNASEYVRWEARWIVMTTTCGAFGYTLMQLCWTAALVAYHGHVRQLKVFLILSLIDLIAFTLSVLACHHAAAPVLAGGIEYLDFHLVVLFNGIGFPVLFVWMLAFTAALGDRHHEFFRESSQQLQHLEFPTNSSLRWTSGLLNSRGFRDIMRLIGKLARTPVLTSDIRNVLYLNWLVPTERVSELLPNGFQVDSRESMTAVSILTYQHGGFGPRFLGKLRRWLPSPLQSNWRVYLDASKQGAGAVYFLKTCLNSSIHVIGSRLMSDGLPSHKSGKFHFEVKQGSGTLNITSQGGSAPDLALKFELDDSPITLPDSWQSRFGDWHATVEYLVSQNKAVDRLGGWASHMESLIEIPIDPRDAVPVRVLGKIDCEMIDGLLQQNDGDLIAFLIPRVPFNFLGEVVTDCE